MKTHHWHLLLGLTTGLVVAQAADPVKKSATEKTAPVVEASAETEEVYIPERPTPPLAPVVGEKGKMKAPVAGTAPVATAKTFVPPPPPLSPRFQQVRDRINQLFEHRSEGPVKIDPRKNPFRPTGAIVASSASAGANAIPAVTAGVPAEPAAPSAGTADLTLLKQAAATLKVAGTIQLNGRDHLIINQVPYKEGDVISARVKGQPAYLRVKNISRYSYTLSLNDAELSVKY
jgi:hypothetical protein